MKLSSGIKFIAERPSNRSFWIAVALGVLAGVANFIYPSRIQGIRIDVLKAKTRLVAGTRPDSSKFTKIAVYSDDMREMRALVVEAKDIGTFAKIPLAESLEPGQILLQRSFRFNGDRGIRNAIGPEERAIALAVKEDTSAAAYFVRPGDTVDVWISRGVNMENLIPKARVHAVDDATVMASDNGGRDFRYRTVTVVVPAEGLGEVLYKLATAKNQVTLALVGTNTAQQ